MSKAVVKFKSLHKDFKLPEKATVGAAGFDMRACLDARVQLYPGETVAVSLGCSVEIPAGYEIQVRPRSGLALKSNITILNSPGTIDSDYRGECKAIVHFAKGFSPIQTPFEINPGDRICQFVINKLPVVGVELVEDLSETDRGAGGFGSTGVK